MAGHTSAAAARQSRTTNITDISPSSNSTDLDISSSGDRASGDDDETAPLPPEVKPRTSRSSPRTVLAATLHLVNPLAKRRSLADVRFTKAEVYNLYVTCWTGLVSLYGMCFFTDKEGCQTVSEIGNYSYLFTIGMTITAAGQSVLWPTLSVYLAQRTPRSTSLLFVRAGLLLGYFNAVCLACVALIPLHYANALHTFFAQTFFVADCATCLCYTVAASRIDLLPRGALSTIVFLGLGSALLLISYMLVYNFIPGIRIDWPYCVYTGAEFVSAGLCLVYPLCYGPAIREAARTGIDHARLPDASADAAAATDPAGKADRSLDDINPSWTDQQNRGAGFGDDFSPDSFTFSEFGGDAELEGMPGAGYSVDPFKSANRHPNAPRNMFKAMVQLLSPCRKQRSLADVRFNLVEVAIMYSASLIGLVSLIGALVFSDIKGCDTISAIAAESKVFRVGIAIAALGLAPGWGFIAVYLAQRSPRSLSKLTIRVALWLGLISAICLFGVAVVPVSYWNELHYLFAQLSFLCGCLTCLLFSISATKVDLLPKSALITLILLTGATIVLLLSYLLANGYVPGVSLKWPFCVYTNVQFFTVAMAFLFPMCFGPAINHAIHTVDFARMYYYD
ncbi:hypothetical protein FOL47_001358 [Perkinsus chesapeaki]|uniref:CWH43-like N-terminal domain-containing protein n=1 Tax=Perkinsus chesapeaki TaxID=330153 RepID=A0A7J6MJB0_PERCH|nr:hypothetical protein FOL47_001358 [Perkinsus chesapeaki]